MSAEEGQREEYGYHYRFKIPLSHPAARAFYLQDLFVPHSRREMALTAVSTASDFAGRAVLRSFGLRRSARLDEFTAGFDAVVGKVCRMLREQGLLVGGEPSFITLHGDGHSQRGKAVLFVLDGQASHPSVIIKVTAHAEEAAVMEREHAALRSIGSRLGERMRTTLPTPLAAAQDDSHYAFAESYLPGRSMYLQLRRSFVPRRHVEQHFSIALDWLFDFQQATRVGEYRVGDVSPQSIAGILEQYQRIVGLTDEEHRLFADTMRKVHELEDERLPVVACQGDFWARNLIIENGTVGVLDWENYSERSSPFFDPFLFMTSYGLSYPWSLGRWAKPGVTFRATYGRGSWMARTVRRHLQEYCIRLGVSPKLLNVFFPVFVAQHAIDEIERAVPLSDTRNGQDAHMSGAAHHSLSAKGQMWSKLVQECALLEGSACFG